MFVRYPWDSVHLGELDAEKTFVWLATTFQKAHPVMAASGDPCGGTLINGRKLDANSFPTGVVQVIYRIILVWGSGGRIFL